MQKENKRFRRAVIILCFVILSLARIPYYNKSIWEILIPPIRTYRNGFISGGVFLAGLIPLLLIFWCCREIKLSNERIVSTWMLFIAIYLIISIYGNWFYGELNSLTYRMKSGASAIQMKDCRLGYYSSGNKDNHLQVSLDSQHFDNDKEKIVSNVKLILDESVNEYLDDNEINFEDIHIVHSIEFEDSMEIQLNFKEGIIPDKKFEEIIRYSDFKVGIKEKGDKSEKWVITNFVNR